MAVTVRRALGCSVTTALLGRAVVVPADVPDGRPHGEPVLLRIPKTSMTPVLAGGATPTWRGHTLDHGE